MKKKSLALIVVAFAIISGTLIFARSRNAAEQKPAPQTQAVARLVSGPGRVEPSTEDIKLGSELSGKLKSVNVEEGDAIHRGQVLAVLVNDDYIAQVASAEADLKAKKATLRKVINGARGQERREAMSSVRAQQATMDNARAEAERVAARIATRGAATEHLVATS